MENWQVFFKVRIHLFNKTAFLSPFWSKNVYALCLYELTNFMEAGEIEKLKVEL